MDNASPVTNRDIYLYLNTLGFPHSLSGRRYIFDAIQTCIENPAYKLQVLKIYEVIARKNEVTPASVERCIRHSLRAAGIGGTNKEFIARSADFFLDGV